MASTKPGRFAGPFDPRWAWVWRDALIVVPLWELNGPPVDLVHMECAGPRNAAFVPDWMGTELGSAGLFQGGTSDAGNTGYGWLWSGAEYWPFNTDDITVCAVFASEDPSSANTRSVYYSWGARLVVRSSDDVVQWGIAASAQGAYVSSIKGRPHTFVGTYRLNDTAKAWWDGVKIIDVDPAVWGALTAYDPVVGCHPGTSKAKDSHEGPILLAASFNRAWTEDEAVEWSQDPFGFIGPDRIPKRSRLTFSESANMDANAALTCAALATFARSLGLDAAASASLATIATILESADLGSSAGVSLARSLIVSQALTLAGVGAITVDTEAELGAALELAAAAGISTDTLLSAVAAASLGANAGLDLATIGQFDRGVALAVQLALGAAVAEVFGTISLGAETAVGLARVLTLPASLALGSAESVSLANIITTSQSVNLGAEASIQAAALAQLGVAVALAVELGFTAEGLSGVTEAITLAVNAGISSASILDAIGAVLAALDAGVTAETIADLHVSETLGATLTSAGVAGLVAAGTATLGASAGISVGLGQIFAEALTLAIAQGVTVSAVLSALAAALLAIDAGVVPTSQADLGAAVQLPANAQVALSAPGVFDRVVALAIELAADFVLGDVAAFLSALLNLRPAVSSDVQRVRAGVSFEAEVVRPLVTGDSGTRAGVSSEDDGIRPAISGDPELNE